MAKNGKRLQNEYKNVDREKLYTLKDAVALLKKQIPLKFDQMVEIAINLNIDPRKADQNIRGAFLLPNGNGKTVRVAVFAKGPKAEEALKAGADLVGAEDLIEKIAAGDISFDRCIATPDMMGVIGKVAKILGPRGLMPNPKLGTVTLNVEEAIKAAKGGQVEYRADKTGIIHIGVGKMSFEELKLMDNIKAFYATIQGVRPSGVKGSFVKRVSLSSSMGVGLKIDLTSLVGEL
jgi:large subunit ribosomal protein L1